MTFHFLRISGGDFSVLKQSKGTPRLTPAVKDLGCNMGPGPLFSYRRRGWDLSHQQLTQGLNTAFLSLPLWELLLPVPRHTVLQETELCSPWARQHRSCFLLDAAAVGCALGCPQLTEQPPRALEMLRLFKDTKTAPTFPLPGLSLALFVPAWHNGVSRHCTANNNFKVPF